MVNKNTGKSYVYNLKRVDYYEALKIQNSLNDQVNDGLIDDSFMFLEHDDIYTAGVHYHGDPGIAVKVNRGGYLTYHGPGQLVVYYIINLKKRNMNALDLIKKIQGDVISLLSIYGISGNPMFNEKTGVWAGDKKICSIGLGINRFSTLHGIGLNVSTDLSRFNKIDPCNFPSNVMSSMEKLSGKKLPFEEIKHKFIDITLNSFKVNNICYLDSPVLP
ncbi:MAG: lipoyl(octanoyl) transferase LipB [Ferroplasma sp.]